MPKMVLDNLSWLPVESVDAERIRSELTVYPKVFRGEAEPIMLYEEKDGLLGVPRNWGMTRRGMMGLDLEDQTIYPHVEWPELIFPEGGTWRPGQLEAIENTEKELREQTGTLLEAGCGAGKTVIGATLAARMKTAVLVLVHKADLANQWRDTFLGSSDRWGFFPGAAIGKVQAGKWDYVAKHAVIATAQTLYRGHENGSIPPDFFDQFGMVIYDEGHRYPARTFEKVMRLPKARYRLGVSATWRRRDALEHLWAWHIGRIGWKMVQERLTGEFIQIPWKTRYTDYDMRQFGTVSHSKWVNAIAGDALYNEWLVQEIIRGSGRGRRVLVCSDRIDHLVALYKGLHSANICTTVDYYCSSLPDETGKRRTRSTKELLKAKEAGVILATYSMMSEGTDIPALDTLYLATPRRDIEQVTGRIQRPKEGKRPLLVIDPVFKSGYNRGMAIARAKFFNQMGFTERVIETKGE